MWKSTLPALFAPILVPMEGIEGFRKSLILVGRYGVVEEWPVSLKSGRYRALFAVVFVTMVALLVLIPVFSVTGNSIGTQTSLFTPRDVAVIVLLSALYALFITMQVYSMRIKYAARVAGSALGGGMGALFAGVAGTAFCASCLAPLFALFGIGFGGVLFVLEYRFFFVAGIVLFMLIAIYLLARSIRRMRDTQRK